MVVSNECIWASDVLFLSCWAWQSFLLRCHTFLWDDRQLDGRKVAASSMFSLNRSLIVHDTCICAIITLKEPVIRKKVWVLFFEVWRACETAREFFKMRARRKLTIACWTFGSRSELETWTFMLAAVNGYNIYRLRTLYFAFKRFLFYFIFKTKIVL